MTQVLTADRGTVVKADHNGLIDYARFVAALGIVWFGVQVPGNWIAYIAVPFFLVLLTMSSGPDLATRAKRLLVPYVIWSLVFAALNTAFAIKRQNPPFDWWEWHMILSGTWMHLWYLPFAFLAGLLSPWFQHPLATIGAAILTATLLALHGTPEAEPWGYWAFGLIPVLVGIAHFSWGWRLAVTTLVSSWLILYFGRPSPENTTILLGTGLALVILSNRLPQTPLSEWCARLSIWIYLAHPLVIIVGHSLRITWIELGLFSLVGSVILAQLIESTLQASRKGQLEF
jgi:hypothetical protein